MNRFLISCHATDAAAMNTLFTGLPAHSDCEAFPWQPEYQDLPPLLFKLLPHLRHLHDTWIISLYDNEALETMVALMESIAWQHDDQVMVVSDTAREVWTFAQFHKRVMVDGVYKEEG